MHFWALHWLSIVGTKYENGKFLFGATDSENLSILSHLLNSFSFSLCFVCTIKSRNSELG
jgi:hypothetical protein